MLQQAEKTMISLKPEQRQVLTEIARQEGQEFDAFIAQILQGVIDKKHAETDAMKDKRIRQNFDRIRLHRKTFLARRNNTPLAVDTVALLEQIRDEHDKHLLALLTDYRG